jgi:putative addiction module component (TIGR02574 family)
MNKALLKELMDLPPAERLQLVEELWDSIEPQDLPPLTDEQIKEIEQDWADHKRDPSSAVPWEEVRSWLRSRRK